MLDTPWLREIKDGGSSMDWEGKTESSTELAESSKAQTGFYHSFSGWGISAWGDEHQYFRHPFTIEPKSCQPGEMCFHYTTVRSFLCPSSILPEKRSDGLGDDAESGLRAGLLFPFERTLLPQTWCPPWTHCLHRLPLPPSVWLRLRLGLRFRLGLRLLGLGLHRLPIPPSVWQELAGGRGEVHRRMIL